MSQACVVKNCFNEASVPGPLCRKHRIFENTAMVLFCCTVVLFGVAAIQQIAGLP